MRFIEQSIDLFFAFTSHPVVEFVGGMFIVAISMAAMLGALS